MNPIQWFQQAQRIHAICPCCDCVFRLSDAIIYIASRPPKTPFDRLREAIDEHETLVERFELERSVMMEEQRRRGAAQADVALRKIAPSFVDRDVDPRDVKVLFDPVTYVVFRGLSTNTLTGIELIDEEPTSSARETLLRSIEAAIQKGNVGWATWRVSETGMVVCDHAR